MTELAVIVAAYNEADRIGPTLAALRTTFPAATLWVADDGSDDGTAAVAERHGARVVETGRRLGKGGAATMAANAVLREGDPTVLLADADLGASAAALARVVAAVVPRTGEVTPRQTGDGRLPDSAASPGEADLAIATFTRRVGGGFGLAVGSARWGIRRATGRTMEAPISGQRAIRPGVLAKLLPFASGFGMETGMTIDALRAGLTVVEVPLDLEHRATGKTLQGFMHRGRQAKDIVRAYASRR